MKNIFFISWIILLSFHEGFAQIIVKELLCENRHNPSGIDIITPRFSWQLESGQRNIMQTAYEIRVGNRFANTVLWNSGKQSGSQSVFVPYGGSALQSATQYFWQVRVWDNRGNLSAWSEKAYWQTGMLNQNEWKAKWIESTSAGDTVNGPALLFRKLFTVRKKIVSATAFVTAHGMYEAFINGQRIGDAILTPGWTSYLKRLQYQAYDLTGKLKNGENVLAMNVGSGWYRTPLAWNNNKNLYGKKIGVLVQVNIIYSDGTLDQIISDNSWKTSDSGPIRASEIYDGETYDARLEKPGWNAPGYNDQDWQHVVENDYPKSNLLATYNEPVRTHESFKALRIFTTPKGERVIDFGQNLVGWETILIKGKRGDTITIDHAEVLDKQGNFYTENLRAAKSRNIYVLNGDDGEVLSPHFTFHGFRFIRIKGLEGDLSAANISATTLYSDMDANRPVQLFQSYAESVTA